MACSGSVHDNVKEYYGERVKTSEDLMTSCCTVDRDTFSSEAREAMKLIHPQVLAKYSHTVQCDTCPVYWGLIQGFQDDNIMLVIFSRL